MRLITARLGIIALILIILTAAFPAGTLTSPQYVPMPPGDFSLYKSDHFDIYYDPTRISDVSAVVVAANAAYDNVTGFYGSFDYRDRIILASSHDQYSNVLYNYLTNENISDNNVSSAWGDAESGTIVIETPDQLSNFSAVLTHQFAKIVMRTKLISNKYNVPLWFSEGLAIYLSGDISDSGRAMVDNACRDGKMMTVAQVNTVLSQAGDPATSSTEVQMAYAQSGMLMQYIVDKFGVDSVKLIIQDYATSGDLDKSFMRRLGFGPEGLNAEWQIALKSDLSVQDGLVTAESIRGHVDEAAGSPIGNQTVIFTCTRNDTAVYGRNYVASTNSTGYYDVNVTYGSYKVHIERPGYQNVDDSITLQKGDNLVYDVTMRLTEAPSTTQAVATIPRAADNTMIYVALGIVNALAFLLIVFVFWRARK